MACRLLGIIMVCHSGNYCIYEVWVYDYEWKSGYIEWDLNKWECEYMEWNFEYGMKLNIWKKIANGMIVNIWIERWKYGMKLEFMERECEYIWKETSRWLVGWLAQQFSHICTVRFYNQYITPPCCYTTGQSLLILYYFFMFV